MEARRDNRRVSVYFKEEIGAVDHRWALQSGEVIDHNLLQGLAILARANERSIVEELNIAVSSYVQENLPLKLGEDGLNLFLSELREETVLRRKHAGFENR